MKVLSIKKDSSTLRKHLCISVLDYIHSLISPYSRRSVKKMTHRKIHTAINILCSSVSHRHTYKAQREQTGEVKFVLLVLVTKRLGSEQHANVLLYSVFLCF